MTALKWPTRLSPWRSKSRTERARTVPERGRAGSRTSRSLGKWVDDRTVESCHSPCASVASLSHRDRKT